MSDQADSLASAWDRFEINLQRVQALMTVARSQRLLPFSTGVIGPNTDILRAGVVFLHATLEEWLRAVASRLLVKCDQRILNEVPLLGLSDGSRASKFLLGDLKRHENLAVRDLIQASIDQYLNRTTFNNVADVGNWLKHLGLREGELEPLIRELAPAIQRRHQIVHQADQSSKRTGGCHEPAQILEEDLIRWMDTVRKFGEALRVRALSVLPHSELGSSGGIG